MLPCPVNCGFFRLELRRRRVALLKCHLGIADVPALAEMCPLWAHAQPTHATPSLFAPHARPRLAAACIPPARPPHSSSAASARRITRRLCRSSLEITCEAAHAPRATSRFLVPAAHVPLPQHTPGHEAPALPLTPAVPRPSFPPKHTSRLDHPASIPPRHDPRPSPTGTGASSTCCSRPLSPPSPSVTAAPGAGSARITPQPCAPSTLRPPSALHPAQPSPSRREDGARGGGSPSRAGLTSCTDEKRGSVGGKRGRRTSVLHRRRPRSKQKANERPLVGTPHAWVGV